MTPFDDRPCKLGEGPLWHPERQQLFWFDIITKRLLTRDEAGPAEWQFDEHVSAAGWIDADRLLIASASGLLTFDIGTGAQTLVTPLEADNPVTRSNDGRADPWGGFWIGTMGVHAEPDAGAIYRYYRGELRRLHTQISIPNSICFSPDRRFAYFSDTITQIVQRQQLDPKNGWPTGAPAPWLDLRAENLNPDGAVVDAEGGIWIAQWGASRVARYDNMGRFVQAVAVPGEQASCPAFGGPDLTTLYCTSANVGLGRERCAAEPQHGMTFSVPGIGPGQAEPRVRL